MKTSRTDSSKLLSYTNRLLIGLIISLSFTLTAFEYTSVNTLEVSEFDTLLIEGGETILPPITYRVEKIEKPQPKTKTSTEFIVVEKIETLETKKKLEVNPIDHQHNIDQIDWNALGMTEEIIDEEEPPTSAAEVYAGYGNCEGLTNSESYLCATKEIIQCIQANFEIPEDLKFTGGEFDALVQFVVDKEGNVTEVKSVRANHPSMGTASEKAVEKLPKMNPATQRGRPVNLIMTVPISLNVAP